MRSCSRAAPPSRTICSVTSCVSARAKELSPPSASAPPGELDFWRSTGRSRRQSSSPRFYTAGVGILSASLFVPTVAGIWWKRANLLGGVLALVLGAVTYVVIYGFGHFGILDVGLSPILVALPASAVAMLIGGLFGRPESDAMLEQVAGLHRIDAEPS